jgi:hypothetical protein
MLENVLLRVKGSAWVSNSWKQELVITETAIHGEVVKGLRRLKMTLPFDRVAQVNVSRGIFTANIEVVNKGGSDNLIVRALSKKSAEAAKSLIEQRIMAAVQPIPEMVSIADELIKLAGLRDRGILTDEEFNGQKILLLK